MNRCDVEEMRFGWNVNVARGAAPAHGQFAPHACEWGVNGA